LTEYEPWPIEAKQKLAVDAHIFTESSLFQVLQRIYEELAEALPQAWVSFAADVSDVMAVRLGFVGGADKIFMDRKDL